MRNRGFRAQPAVPDSTPERRTITARLVRPGEDPNAFDREFWDAVGPEVRLEALWDMVLELRAWKGEEGDQPRLQRSVVRLVRP